ALQLQQQTGDQVDRAAELRNFADMQSHPEIVLRGMQANPGHQRFAADIVRIIGLMLVPEEGESDRSHGPRQTMSKASDGREHSPGNSRNQWFSSSIGTLTERTDSSAFA